MTVAGHIPQINGDISFFEKDKSHYNETLNFEIPDSLNNDLNFKVILNLLKKNIRSIEKNLGFFLTSGNISIQSSSHQSILLSIKSIFDEYYGYHSRYK